MLTPVAITKRLRIAGCVFAEDEAAVLLGSAESAEELERMVVLREKGEPLEIIVGWALLSGIRFVTAPGVFVPRARTEFLVELARSAGGAVLLDLCCGSGAVGAAVAAGLDAAELHASDIDQAAVECARRNVVGEVYRGDLFSPLPPSLRGRVEIMTLIAPYVPTDDIALLPREARLFEPGVALDGGVDGLAIVRRVAAEVTEWLAPGGSLFTEVSEEQAPTVVELFRARGMRARIEHDAARFATVVVATA